VTVQNQRDLDQIEIIRKLRQDLDELTNTVVGRWGRVPIVTADPTSPPDGTIWIRSDLNKIRFRSGGVTYSAP